MRGTFLFLKSTLFLFAFAVLALSGCAREKEDSANVMLKFPQLGSNGSFGKLSTTSNTSTKVVSSKTVSALNTTSESAMEWSSTATPPTDAASIQCYGLAISSPGASRMCVDSDYNPLFLVSRLEGIFPAGSTIQVADLPIGTTTFRLIAFTTDGDPNVDCTESFDPSVLSEPLVVDEVTVNLVGGNNSVGMVIPDDFEDPIENVYPFNSCESLMTDNDLSAPAVITSSAINTPGNSTAFISNDKINITLTFDKMVQPIVNNVYENLPYILLKVGTVEKRAYLDLAYSVDEELVFAYEVDPGIEVTNFEISAGKHIFLNGSVLVDEYNIPVNLTIPADPSIREFAWDIDSIDHPSLAQLEFYEFSPDYAAYSFGNVVYQNGLTNNRVKTITVVNSGSNDATGLTYNLATGTKFSILTGTSGGTCAANMTLLPKQTCTLVIKYTPTAIDLDNADTDTIEITYDQTGGDADETNELSIEGYGVSLAALTAFEYGSPDYTFTNSNPINFQVVQLYEFSDMSIDIQNIGGSLAKINSVTLSGSSYYKLSHQDCTIVSIESGQTCMIYLEYLPLALGIHTASLTINFYNGVTNVNRTIPITGKSSNSDLLFDDSYRYLSNLQFGQTASGGTTIRTISIHNTSATTKTISAAMINGTGFSFSGGSFGTSGDCDDPIPATNTCSIALVYTGSGTGSHTGSLQITYDGGQTGTLDLKGISTSPANITVTGINISAGTLNFGQQTVYTTSTSTITLTNTGGYIADSFTVPAPPNGYTIYNNCAVLEPSETCTMIVNFYPTLSAITYNGNILINYDNGTATPANFVLPVTGLTP